MLLDECQERATGLHPGMVCLLPPGPASAAVAAPAHPALVEQQGFADQRDRVLRRAEPSGQRLVTALYLVLSCHRPVAARDDDGRAHLSCAECRPEGREPAAQYPCPSAQQAFWALDAALH